MGGSGSAPVPPQSSADSREDTNPGASAAMSWDTAEQILLNVPAREVANLRLVSADFRDLVDSNSHWRERCRREGIHPWDYRRVPTNWREFYFITKNRRNLIKNPKAEEGFSEWKIVQNGGDLWAIEDNAISIPNHSVSRYYVTSYGMCMKQQVIDLEKEGYSSAFMDHMQPLIKISDWYAPRNDCGAVYHIIVELLNHEKNPIHTFKPEPVRFPQWTEWMWYEMTHVFREYGSGVRFIRFTHGGKDTQFWAGHYGIRVTNSSVEICPAVVS